MKIKVLDSFYSSELKQMHAGGEFDPEEAGVSDARLKEWEKRGFVAPQPETKAEAAPKNKAEPAPENKAVGKVALSDPQAAEKLVSKSKRIVK